MKIQRDKNMNKNSETVKFPISLPEELKSRIKARGLSISKKLRTTINYTLLEPKYLYEISFPKESSLHYVIIKDLDSNKALDALYCYPRLYHLVKAYGVGEFIPKLVGSFPQMSNALEYRNYLINKALNQGYSTDHQESEYHRHFLISGPYYPRLKRLIESKTNLTNLLELVVSIIDESNPPDLSSDTPEMTKLRNQIRKVIRKKIKLPEVRI
jgi:hypothetical protein